MKTKMKKLKELLFSDSEKDPMLSIGYIIFKNFVVSFFTAVDLFFLMILLYFLADANIEKMIPEISNNFITFTLSILFHPIIWLFPFLMKKDLKKRMDDLSEYKKAQKELKEMIDENPNILQELEKDIEELSTHKITFTYTFKFEEDSVDNFYKWSQKRIKRCYEPTEEFKKYRKAILTKRKLLKKLEKYEKI